LNDLKSCLSCNKVFINVISNPASAGEKPAIRWQFSHFATLRSK
jgi:hypothetical protein